MAAPIDKTIKKSTGVALALLLLVFLCFHKSLGCYFTADDFWHLSRLHDAVNGNPHLLFENFWKPWVDKTLIYKFYRPFTEITLAFDYLLWGKNPFGFHLSNLVYHWINSFLVYLTIQKFLLIFLKPDEKFKTYKASYFFLAPILIASLFASHPINTEPVTWIASRADLIGTLFYLLTINFYLHFSQTNYANYKILSILALTFGLLSKEVCATAPLVISLIYATTIWAETQSKKEVISLTFIHTKFYWLITFVYLIIRSFALKAFLGGYVGSAAYMLNSSILERLMIPQTFWKIIYPINNQLPDAALAPEFLLRSLYFFIGVLVLANIFSQSIKSRTKIVLGCMLWSLIIIAISVQVWSVNDNLSGGRIIYLLLIPLATSFTLLILPPPLLKSNTIYLKFNSLFLAFFIVVFVFVSNLNTSAWLSASSEIKALQKEIIATLDKVPQSKKLAVYNIPPYILGTMAFCNTDFLQGFLSPPLCEKNYYRRVISADGSLIPTPIVNDFNFFNYTKRTSLILSRWNRKTKKLTLINSQFSKFDLLRESMSPLQIRELGSFEQVKRRSRSKPDTLFSNPKPGSQISSYLVNIPKSKRIPSQYTLLFKISNSLKEPNKIEISNTEKVRISWKESSRKYSDSKNAMVLHIKNTDGIRWYRYPFFDFKEWVGSTPPELIRIDLPGAKYKLLDCLLENKLYTKPFLEIGSKYDYRTNGIIKPKDNYIIVNYDTGNIPRSSKVFYEISEPNCQFELYTKPTKAPYSIKKYLDNNRGEIRISDFQLKEKRAFYQLRLRALDKENKMLGIYSAPVTFSFNL